MAAVGASVKKSIDDWSLGKFDFAMLHACNAVDGTARKTFPSLRSNAGFTRLLRENYAILGPMGAPGINLVETRWPVEVQRPKAEGGLPDIADVVYGIHRCTHGHGEELPAGFELFADAAGPAQFTRMGCERGRVRLSDRMIFALLAVAIFSPVNSDQCVPDTYYLTFAGKPLPINEWWGRASDFLVIAATVQMPSVRLNFGDWHDPLPPAGEA